MKKFISPIFGRVLLAASFSILPIIMTQAAEDGPDDGSLAAMKAYKAVLQNKTTFYSTDDHKHYRLSEFDYWDDSYNHPLEVYRFAVIDMDDDGMPEVVLELTTGFDGAFEVLHYEDGMVYGFNFVYRGMLGLSRNGMYVGSSGADDNSILKAASIKKDAYEEDEVAYSESGQDANGDLVVSYYIGGSKTTEDEFNAVSQRVFDNPVDWHDYTEANIASVFE
ncbi:MAG: hypothetical protein FWF95_08455 [Syntrophorhabdaceae bacterium]|nr:hypothetical protein [Syntrophorhabdaceae bacterium]